MRRYINELVALFVLFAFISVPSAFGGDLDSLQGTWQMVTNSNGVEQRVVKTVIGAKETVEVFVNDKLVQRHHVDFELKEFGPARVFIWKNGRIAVGPNAGKRLPDGRFIYRIEVRTWTAVHGMLDGDKTGVLREVYQRVGDPPKPPAS